MSRCGQGCPLDRLTLLKQVNDAVTGLDPAHVDKKISVVIPVYNGSRYLEKAILSVAAQTLPPHEIIVVDDGSTDGSAEVIKALAPKYPLKFLQKENGGQSSARNYGIRAAAGDLIALLDQDDIWYPNHLEELVRPFLEERHPEIGWVYSDLDEIGENGELYSVNFLSFGDSKHPKKSLLQCLQTDMFVVPSVTLIAKKAFDDVGGFDERLSGYEDDDLFLRIFTKGYGNVFINKSLAQWRLHGHSCSWSNSMAASRIIYAKKLLNQYDDDYVRGHKYRTNVILPRFIKIILAEYSRGVIFKNNGYIKLMRGNLYELFPYMNFKQKLQCYAKLFIFRFQLLKSILRPFVQVLRKLRA
jgi:glycosyltransferase involved in cell wall biosynthesis